jgi:hypothetical protein
MKFDFDHYRIELAQEDVRLSLSHDAAEGPYKAQGASSLLLYSNHDRDSDQLNMALRKGDATEILGVWTPASFNVTNGIGNVMCDQHPLQFVLGERDPTAVLGRLDGKRNRQILLR